MAEEERQTTGKIRVDGHLVEYTRGDRINHQQWAPSRTKIHWQCGAVQGGTKEMPPLPEIWSSRLVMQRTGEMRPLQRPT